jgi:hypothetical protein
MTELVIKRRLGDGNTGNEDRYPNFDNTETPEIERGVAAASKNLGIGNYALSLFPRNFILRIISCKSSSRHILEYM